MTPPAAVRVHAGDTDLNHWDDRDAKGTVGFRTLIDTDHGPSSGVTQGLAEFGPGDTEGPHHHDLPETAFVVDGGGHLDLPGEAMAVRAGDMLFVPPDLVHGWRAGDEGMRILYTFPADRLADVAYHWADA